MSEATKIEWTARPGPDGRMRAGMTQNFWIGCTHCGDECDNCYADELDSRYKYGGATHFGKGVPRFLTSDENWRMPYRWNKAAKRNGWRPAVFMSSLSDWADPEVSQDWALAALKVVEECPHLEWLLLTKRPANGFRLLSLAFPRGIPGHIRVGTSVGNSTGLRRIPPLLAIEASHFLSVEPLLGEVDLYPFLVPAAIKNGFGIDQVIVGGESGENARPMSHSWVRNIFTDCWRTGTPFYFKQNGEWAPISCVRDPQARAMARLGNVKKHVFFDDDEGSDTVYRFGKKVAGNFWEKAKDEIAQTLMLPREPMRLTNDRCACEACGDSKGKLLL
jgi:protein gp37